MKNDVMPSIVQMDADELKTLLKEVKETVATGFEMSNQVKKVFGVTDMWKIRRQSKSANSLLKR